MICLSAANIYHQGMWLLHETKRFPSCSHCRIDWTELKDTCYYSVKTVHTDVEVITQDNIFFILKIDALYVLYSDKERWNMHMLVEDMQGHGPERF